VANSARSRNVLDLVEGWTKAEPLRLNDDGVPVDLTGKTVALEIHDKDGGAVAGVSVAKDADQVANPGLVWLTPAASLTNAASPFSIHVAVTDGAGKVVKYPQGAASTITVYKP